MNDRWKRRHPYDCTNSLGMVLLGEFLSFFIKKKKEPVQDKEQALEKKKVMKEVTGLVLINKLLNLRSVS